MNHKNIAKCCVVVLAVYIVLAVLFWWIAGDQMRFREETTVSIHAASPVGEIIPGVEIRQPFLANADEITGVSLLLSTYERQNVSQLVIGIENTDGNRIAESVLDTLTLIDNTVCDIKFPAPVDVDSGEWYELVLFSANAASGNAVTAWFGNTVKTARMEIPLRLTERQKLRVNGQVWEGELSYSLHMRTDLWFGKYYWQIATAAAVLLGLYLLYLVRCVRLGKSNIVLRIISAFQRYGYLLRQLVARDFKTKYKRSILGVFWSLLNPLLTMLVQYIVFSTLFKSDIPNFPLYLLSGIVCFNFFNEATTMALQSIVGNASLITKVYVPKYIYPVSRVLSSTINLLLSMILLLAAMLLTRTPVRPAILLLPFGLVCLLAFCIGMGFILSSVMVFFRDTQFLWGVLTMLWMYATPIFYPESIIAEEFSLLYKCNPLYHIIRFVRILLINGVSPEPKAYGLCLIASFSVLLVGAVIFKKSQDKFVLYL